MNPLGHRAAIRREWADPRLWFWVGLAAGTLAVAVRAIW